MDLKIGLAEAALGRRVTVLSAQRERPGPPGGLTPGESEICRLIAPACTKKEIMRGFAPGSRP
jgi:hypothetical protein